MRCIGDAALARNRSAGENAAVSGFADIWFQGSPLMRLRLVALYYALIVIGVLTSGAGHGVGVVIIFILAFPWSLIIGPDVILNAIVLLFVGPIEMFALAAGIEWLAGGKSPKVRNAAVCARCGYLLRGNQSGVCPECGTVMRKPAIVTAVSQAPDATSDDVSPPTQLSNSESGKTGD